MAKNEKHYKTRQAVAQATGNVGAQLSRNAGAEGLKRMAAHEKAVRDLARLREAAVSAHNNAVAWQNQKLANIERGYRPRISGATRGLDEAREALAQYHANVERMGQRVARGNTNRMVHEATDRVKSAVGTAQRAYETTRSGRRLSVATGGGSRVYEAANRRAAQKATARVREAVQSRNELVRMRAAGAEARDASAYMNRTLQGRRAKALRADVFGAEQKLRQIEAAMQGSRRAAIDHTRAYTQQVQQRFNAAASRVMEKAGPKATFFQRAMAKMSRIGKPLAGSTVENVAAPTGAAAKKGLGIFATRAEIAARVAEIGKTSPKTAAALRRSGLIAEGVVKKGGGLVIGAAKKAATHWGGLRLPVKMIAGGLNTVEAAGRLVAGSGKAGKIVTGLTNAAGLAGGLATGAWIDAGLNWAEASADARKMGYTGFFGKGGMWESLGKANHTETVRDDNGVEHVVDYHNPTLGDVVTSKEYWGEVTRGTLRNLTFGIFGQDKYEWEQDGRPPEERSKQWNERYLAGLDPATGEVIRDRNGNDVSHILAKQRMAEQAQVNRAQGIAAYFMSFDPANKDKAKGAGNASIGRGALGFAANAQTDAVGFITAVKHLGELKDQQIEAARQMAVQGGQNRYVDRRMSQLQRSGMTREQAVEAYVQEVGRHQDKQYEERLGMMLKSDAAAKASDMNRKFAYLALTGRDYDVDTKSDLAEGAKQGYADFNAAWGEMSDRDRVLFDREAFGKSIADSAASEYKTLTGTKEEEVSDGDAAEPTA